MRVKSRVAAFTVASFLLAACATNSDGGEKSASTSTTAGGVGTTVVDTTMPAPTAPPSTTTIATTTSIAPTTTVAPTTTTTTEAQPTSPTYDELKGASIPAMCMHEPTTLVDGKDQNLGPNDGVFELQPTLRRGGVSGILEGVPSEVGPLTAIVASCNAGGVNWPNPVLFFAPGGQFYAATFLDGPDGTGETLTEEWQAQWEAAGALSPAREGIYSLERDGDGVTIVLDAETMGDAACCPSGEVAVTIRPVNGTIELVDIVWAGGD